MKIHCVSVHPMPTAQAEKLASMFEVHVLPGEAAKLPIDAPWAKEVRILQTSGQWGATRAFMESMPKLEMVSCYGVGVDAVDLGYCRERKIPVGNTPAVLNDDVADLALGLMLMASRRLGVGERYVRAGRWAREGNMPLARKLSGKTLGILGLGRIGKQIARRAEAFDMPIVYFGRHRQDGVAYRYYDDLTAMARDVDVLCAICPGGDATRNLVNRAVMEALGPDGILVNVARGSVVDEAALVEVLRASKLGVAALDVFVAEPQVPEALFALDNVVLQPHVGSATVETRAAMGDLVIENISCHLEGRPLRARVV
jgi:lactate dehydrogenase-like 2-hydroxyacid dehydrogenase